MLNGMCIACSNVRSVNETPSISVGTLLALTDFCFKRVESLVLSNSHCLSNRIPFSVLSILCNNCPLVDSLENQVSLVICVPTRFFQNPVISRLYDCKWFTYVYVNSFALTRYCPIDRIMWRKPFCGHLFQMIKIDLVYQRSVIDYCSTMEKAIGSG